MIRSCNGTDFETIYVIINDAAEAYRSVIPVDRWQEPYMSRKELRGEIEAGGDLLSIEVTLMAGKGNLTLTGQLGDVVQESAQAALISPLSKRPVQRDVAMPGEITLRRRVLAIGGLKEYGIAAHRASVKTVLTPERNQKDFVLTLPTLASA